MQTVLFFLHYAALLLFGILLSFAYAGVQVHNKRNLWIIGGVFVFTGCLQLAGYCFLDEEFVWKLYPLITHIPIILCLSLFCKTSVIAAVASVTSAYLCCQPAKWAGLLTLTLTGNTAAELIVRLLFLAAMGYLAIWHVAPCLSKLFAKDFRSVCIFGSIPAVYYAFDYFAGIYTGLRTGNHQIIAEFIPFIMSMFFLVFCTMYYKEYERKSEAESREQLIRIAVQQQQAHIDAVKRTETELRILRHDMRLFLNGLAACLENSESDKARDMIHSYISRIDGTKLEHFCKNDFVNYVLSDFSFRCKAANIPFVCSLEIDSPDVDEMLFCLILSNALDNAFNAQDSVPPAKRCVKLMLKKADGKLLLSVKNPVSNPPVFADGLPVTNRKGHGFGTQSIRHITQSLGGNCQFSTQDGWFILRVVL